MLIKVGEIVKGRLKMQKPKLSWKEYLTIIAILWIVIILSSCTTTKVEIQDNRIMAYWIDYEEPAPFRGVLLNEYTFKQLERKAEECQKLQK
jgi:hypothetical protein